MAPAEAFAELRKMVEGIEAARPDADPKACAARLLERMSVRVDALELRAALVEFGARACFDAIALLPDA